MKKKFRTDTHTQNKKSETKYLFHNMLPLSIKNTEFNLSCFR